MSRCATPYGSSWSDAHRRLASAAQHSPHQRGERREKAERRTLNGPDGALRLDDAYADDLARLPAKQRRDSSRLPLDGHHREDPHLERLDNLGF